MEVLTAIIYLLFYTIAFVGVVVCGILLAGTVVAICLLPIVAVYRLSHPKPRATNAG